MSRYLGRKLPFGTVGARLFLRRSHRQLLSSTFSTGVRHLADPTPIPGAPTEDEVFATGRPTPEQHTQMMAEIEAGGVPPSKSFSPLDVHTVEDIHHLTAEEALAETGTRRDAVLKHFTGTFVVHGYTCEWLSVQRARCSQFRVRLVERVCNLPSLSTCDI
jgi:hypothetical protein